MFVIHFLLLCVLVDLWSFFLSTSLPSLSKGLFFLAYDVARFLSERRHLQSILSLHLTVTPMAFLDGFLSSEGFFSAYSVAPV